MSQKFGKFMSSLFLSNRKPNSLSLEREATIGVDNKTKMNPVLPSVSFITAAELDFSLRNGFFQAHRLLWGCGVGLSENGCPVFDCVYPEENRK